MPVEIKCYRCGKTVKVLSEFYGRTLDSLLKEELEGKKCPKCGHEFKGKLAGPITIKASS